MSLKPLNSFSFLGTPERMQKSCDDLETEIKNNPTEENIEKLKTMKEIMRLLSLLTQSGGKSRRRHHRRSSKKHKKARKSRRASRRHSRKH